MLHASANAMAEILGIAPAAALLPISTTSLSATMPSTLATASVTKLHGDEDAEAAKTAPKATPKAGKKRSPADELPHTVDHNQERKKKKRRKGE